MPDVDLSWFLTTWIPTIAFHSHRWCIVLVDGIGLQLITLSFPKIFPSRYCWANNCLQQPPQIMLMICCWVLLGWLWIDHSTANQHYSTSMALHIIMHCTFWPSSSHTMIVILTATNNHIQPSTCHHQPCTLPSMLVRHCATRVCAKWGIWKTRIDRYLGRLAY